MLKGLEVRDMFLSIVYEVQVDVVGSPACLYAPLELADAVDAAVTLVKTPSSNMQLELMDVMLAKKLSSIPLPPTKPPTPTM